MAAARQKEMKVSITVVATKTLMAGRCRFGAAVDMALPGVPGSIQAAIRAARIYQCTASPAALAALSRRIVKRGGYTGRRHSPGECYRSFSSRDAGIRMVRGTVCYYSRFVKYVPLMRSCQQRRSTSTKAQSNPMTREAVEK